MQAQIKHSLALLQDLIPTLDSIKYICKTQDKVEINSCTCVQNVIFVHAFSTEL